MYLEIEDSYDVDPVNVRIACRTLVEDLAPAIRQAVKDGAARADALLQVQQFTQLLSVLQGQLNALTALVGPKSLKVNEPSVWERAHEVDATLQQLRDALSSQEFSAAIRQLCSQGVIEPTRNAQMLAKQHRDELASWRLRQPHAPRYQM